MRPEHDRQHEANLQRRRDDGGEQHQHRDDLLPVLPQVLGASDHGGRGRAPDDRQAEHRNGVRDHVEHRGRERQRERPVERVLTAAPQLLVAARAARRRARRKLREPLQQIAVRAGDERRVGDRPVVHLTRQAHPGPLDNIGPLDSQFPRQWFLLPVGSNCIATTWCAPLAADMQEGPWSEGGP